ncbi:MAG: hypothetical protein IJV65_08530 [Kiritimatiellae bacterium]|nr:hypothetical protein [Kiritimatiellia bacterium]
MRGALLAFCILHCALCIAAADPATLGSIDRTNTVYTATQVDALIAGAGGGAGMDEVTNYVTEAVAELGADDPAAELHKLILADLWRRVDALEGSDGSGAATAVEVERLVAERIAAELSEWGEASGCIPAKVEATSTRSLSGNQTGVSLALTPLSLTVLSSNGSNVYSLSLASVTGTSANPCLLKFVGWRSVAWPGGTLVKNDYTYNANGNLYRVYKAAGTTVAERVYP